MNDFINDIVEIIKKFIIYHSFHVISYLCAFTTRATDTVIGDLDSFWRHQSSWETMRLSWTWNLLNMRKHAKNMKNMQDRLTSEGYLEQGKRVTNWSHASDMGSQHRAWDLQAQRNLTTWDHEISCRNHEKACWSEKNSLGEQKMKMKRVFRARNLMNAHDISWITMRNLMIFWDLIMLISYNVLKKERSQIKIFYPL